jgi:FeS assembly SUF system regulator
MIRISKMADYAVVVLAALARSDEAQMTASGISGTTGLPEPTVAKVLKLLSRGDFLGSTRGVNGGYKLTRSAAEISVAGIISVIDGPIALTACADGSDQPCGYESHCAVKGRWNSVNNAVRGALESVTLADMMHNSCLPRESGDLEDMEIKIPAFAGKTVEGVL